MVPSEVDQRDPSQRPRGRGVRPLERRIRTLANAGCSDEEIARRFRRSAPGIARVRALADLDAPSAPQAVRTDYLRPIERRVVRWSDAGVDSAEIGRRFRRSGGHISRIEGFARRKLADVAQSP